MKTVYPSHLLIFITILSLFAVYTSAAPTSFAEVEESWQRGLSEVSYFLPFLSLFFPFCLPLPFPYSSFFPLPPILIPCLFILQPLYRPFYLPLQTSLPALLSSSRNMSIPLLYLY
jgi:hypothetical protein